MTGRAPIIRALCGDPSLFGSAAPLSLSDYRGVPHDPYRATGATATAAFGEVALAVVTAQPGESSAARAVLRSALAVCRGVGAA
jgi:hypothetical protein